MKMTKIAMACGAALLGVSAVAQAEVSANIGVTSNYVWRGMTQTNDQPAISGGVDYAHDSGFYIGTWASNVDDANGTYGTYELDGYAGFGGEVGDVGYDVGYLYYAYPSGNGGNFGELYGSVSFQMFTVGLAYTTNADTDSAEGDIYYYANASFDLPEGFSLGGTVGHYDYDANSSGTYNHYQLDLGKSAGDYGDFTLSLSANDNDEDPLVFVSWAKSF